MGVAIRVMPSLADVRVVRMWTGVMAFTDDLSPIVGESSAVPGYFTCIATTGFTLSPLMAKLLAEQMASPEGRRLPPEYSPDRNPAGRPAA
jgi:glycine/D-amino acid oxidase-like deaminating enzyme